MNIGEIILAGVIVLSWAFVFAAVLTRGRPHILVDWVKERLGYGED